MSGTPSTVADSEESVMETSTAPTTPDGSLSFSPLLQPMQLLDAFDGILASAGTPTPTIRNVPTNFDLNENAPAAVKNICCVGAGYVGKSVSLLPPSSPLCQRDIVHREVPVISYRDRQGPPRLSIMSAFFDTAAGRPRRITAPRRYLHFFLITS